MSHIPLKYLLYNYLNTFHFKTKNPTEETNDSSLEVIKTYTYYIKYYYTQLGKLTKNNIS